MGHSFSSIGRYSIAAIAVAIVHGTAYAQVPAGQPASSAASNKAEDIVVTAQRRSQKLQDVGISVTAVTSAQLRANGVTTSKEIAKIAPGVIFDATAGGNLNANLTIRGVSQSDFSAFQESPNSIYIDDVYLASPGAAAFTFYDLARVEVLRGPQGTLFGKSSSGGLANFISARPTDTLQGYAEGGIGRFNQAYFEGAVSGPLSDHVRFRISGRAEDADGYFKNENLNGTAAFATKTWGLRGQIEADLTDTLQARLEVSYDDSPRHPEGTYKIYPWYINAAGQPAPLPANVDAYGTGPGNDRTGYRDPYKSAWTSDFNNVGFLKNSRFMPTLYLTWSGNDVTVTSISNYTNFKFDYREDCDGGPVDYCEYPESQNLNQFSQEVRANGNIGRLTYTTGAYFLNVNQSAPQSILFPSLAGSDFAYNATDAIRQKTQDFGVFGQVEYSFTPKLKLTVGARWTNDHKKFDSELSFKELGNGYGLFGIPLGTGSTVYSPPLDVYNFNPQTAGGLADADVNMWSGKVQLDYRLDPDRLLYASVSRGVRGPGFNENTGGTLTFQQTPYQSEYVYAYEAGLKQRLFDDRATLNTSAFYYDYHNFQAFSFVGLSALVGNYDSTFYGGETELNVRLPAQISARVGASYLHTVVKDVQTQYDGIRDQQSVGAPKWTVNGDINKTFPIGANNLAFDYSFDYVSDRYSSIDNSPVTLAPGGLIQNLRVTYRLPADKIEISAFCNNFMNYARVNFVFDYISTTGAKLDSYDKPRWWGLSVRKEF